jgi:hypothetical protein
MGNWELKTVHRALFPAAADHEAKQTEHEEKGSGRLWNDDDRDQTRGEESAVIPAKPRIESRGNDGVETVGALNRG